LDREERGSAVWLPDRMVVGDPDVDGGVARGGKRETGAR
jgi:hypothetical protein